MNIVPFQGFFLNVLIDKKFNKLDNTKILVINISFYNNFRLVLSYALIHERVNETEI